MRRGLFALFVLGACGVDTVSQEPPTLFATIEVPAGAGCSSGGVAIQSGVDDDRDGILDATEITNTALTCNTAPGPSSLVRVLGEPPGANCPYGGTAIATGLDDDGDTVLDDNEVDATAFNCESAQPLIRIDVELAGSNCTNGGTAVRSGLDFNRNDMLDDAEVSSTSYVCVPPATLAQLVQVGNLFPGGICATGGKQIQIGFDIDGDGSLDDGEITSRTDVCGGVKTMVRVEPEEPGDNCYAGGTRIITGIDSNGNNVLDDYEVESTDYVCEPSSVINGNVVIFDESDLAQLEGITQITGGLFIHSDSLIALDLPDLHIIGGGITCGTSVGCNLASVNLPNLAAIAGTSVFRGGPTSISFPSLTTAGAIRVEGDKLATLSLPLLQHGRVQLQSYAPITALSLPQLQTGGVEISFCQDLTTIDLPQFTSGNLVVFSASQLTSISAPLLSTSTWLEISTYGQQLTHLELPALTSANKFAVNQNNGLTSLSAPLLGQASRFEMFSNDVLPNCRAVALWEQAGFPSDVSIGENSTECP
ncbi:MAG: hypothetical protein AB7P03_16275 [Kofleriaceae bacterium]